MLSSEKIHLPEEEADFQNLQDFILRREGFDCRQYKASYLKRRIAVRMRALGLKTYRDYLQAIQRDTSEFLRLHDRLTINVTEFFRDPEAFEVLEAAVVPVILRDRAAEKHDKPGAAKTIRAWSAACASGEEAYSLAIVLAEAAKAFPGISVSVLATDIDKVCLNIAKLGVYEKKAVENLKPSLRKYFEERGGQVKVADSIRKLVNFEEHNLTSQSFPEGFDLILCRNVIIYFSQPVHLSLFERFHDSLRPGGYLMIGKTESMLGKTREIFCCVSARERIYMRLP